MEELMVKIDNVSKQYILGQIGGTTLRDELQRRHAKLLGKEDPTSKIGSRTYQTGENFLALDSVSFDVKNWPFFLRLLLGIDSRKSLVLVNISFNICYQPFKTHFVAMNYFITNSRSEDITQTFRCT